MKRNKYIMPLSEIQALATGLIQFGYTDAYHKMLIKALSVMHKTTSLDEEFMDRSETLLQKARESTQEEDTKNLSNIYYTLSFMLRRLAHTVHLRYIKQGKSVKNKTKRFLKVITNPNPPKLLL